MKTQKKWALSTLILATLILTIVATTNYFVDPYEIYHTKKNDYNYNKISNRDPYLFKTVHSMRYQSQAIILGTSRAMRLNPSTLTALTGEDSYNLGLSASSPYIHLRYVEYLLKNNKNLKTIYLGLDFETFNERHKNHVNFVEERLDNPLLFQDLFATLLTKTVFTDSMRVLYDNMNHSIKYTESQFLDDGSYDESFRIPADINRDLNTIPNQFQLSTNSINYIQQIKELCDQNDIALYLYIGPMHAILLESIWQKNYWSDLEEWVRQLSTIAPVWDFSGFHDISMSSLYHDSYYDDLSHFSKRTGDLMLYRMLGREVETVPPWFGIRLTPDNINEHLDDLRISREQWAEKDKNMQELVLHY